MIEEDSIELGDFKEFLAAVWDVLEVKLFSLGNTKITPLVFLELLLIVVAFLLLSKLLRRFLQKRIMPRFRLDDGVQFTILRLIHYLIIVIGILIALDSVGIELTSLAVAFGLMGVGIAFGLQNITSNFVSGLILLFERPIRVGDYIEVGGTQGRVSSINMRSTTIVTPDNVTLIVPNSRFIEDTVTNWSVGDLKIRLSIPVGVAYGSDTDLVTKLLLEAAGSNPEVLSDPEPSVLFREFGNSSLNFELRAWIPTPNPRVRAKVKSDLNYAIDVAFRKNDVTIPFPQRDVHFYQET